ncbi:MAG TPA: M20 family metallopeptidase [Ktedonobacteraceae bacterium]|jgi:glutamate carboxypeptidase
MQQHRDIAQAEQLMEDYLKDLETIVNIDSGTYTKSGVDHVGTYLQERFRHFGFATYFDPQHEYGNHLVATHEGNASTGPHIMLIGHMDTVFSEGEAQKRPFAIRKRDSDGARIATGPGVLDMKSGLLVGLYGLALANNQQEDGWQRVTFVCNSDEEVGSPASKPLIQELARNVDAVIVLEPGRLLTSVVSRRRGIGTYRVEVHGVSAHAGVEPQKGRNAILELTYQVQQLQALNGTVPGVSLNVGVIRGGERTNVVPDYAYCDIDVRVSDASGLQEIEGALRRVTSHSRLDGTKITLSGSMKCMPFECSERSARLVQLAKEAGNDLGLQIEDLSSGGASDANNTAPLGIPTIDGLGAGGGLAHNPDEYVELDYLPTRIALLKRLLQHISDYYRNGNKL